MHVDVLLLGHHILDNPLFRVEIVEDFLGIESVRTIFEMGNAQIHSRAVLGGLGQYFGFGEIDFHVVGFQAEARVGYFGFGAQKQSLFRYCP